MSSDWAAGAFGLASAATWGAGDFCGGLAAKRTGVYAVVIGSQLAGALIFLLLARALGETAPPPPNMLWSGLAGILGAVGLLALYRSLATGRMGVAAPVSAVIAAAFPALAGSFFDGLPTWIQVAGFALAIPAVWLVSQTGSADLRWQAMGLPILAGLCFGAFLVIIGRANGGGVFWPLTAARAASLSVLTAFATLARRPRFPARENLPLVALAGALDAGGNAFVVLAAQAGRLDVAGVLGSLYPASTILLARLILKERFNRVQIVGIAAVLGAIVLITV